MSSPEIQAKARITSLARYGIAHPVARVHVKECFKQKMLLRYGVPHNFLVPQVRQQVADTMLKRYGVSNISFAPSFRAKAAQTTLDRWGTLNHQNYGKAEETVATYIEQLGFSITRQFQLPNSAKSIDIYIDSKKIGIEYCGLYWHCEPKVQRAAHRIKMDLAAQQGIRLITLFEDEWLQRTAAVQGVLKTILGIPSQSLGARTCTLTQIATGQANAFLVEHHIQGGHAGIKIAFGLFSKANELVGVLTLKHDYRPNTADAIVLQRLCFKHDLHIPGGASKLFAAAKSWSKEQGYKRIISWSDNRWFLGGVYEKLEFTCVNENQCDYAYVDLTKHIRLSKQTQQKQKTDCPPELTELEWANKRGLARIWDCGHKRWELAL